MKLYTEHDMLKAFREGNAFLRNDSFDFKGTFDNLINGLTPIELPTDEDMGVIALKTISELNSKLIENEEAFYIAGFIECAKWMRDKIQGGEQ